MKTPESVKAELEQLLQGDSLPTNEWIARAQAVSLQLISLLNLGQVRAANNIDGDWVVNAWVKDGILLAFKAFPPRKIGSSLCRDKIGPKSLQEHNARTVPTGYIRDGVFVGDKVIVMPSFVNVGSYIGSGTMIDSYATIGSCAQIGENCHISSSAVIAGVLEPSHSLPVIIEEGSFVGAGSIISEGTIVREGAVIAAGVTLTSSTKIIDRNTGKVHIGEIPAYSVVVPGSLRISVDLSLNCAVIVKKVDAETRRKTSINHLLRP